MKNKIYLILLNTLIINPFLYFVLILLIEGSYFETKTIIYLAYFISFFQYMIGFFIGQILFLFSNKIIYPFLSPVLITIIAPYIWIYLLIKHCLEIFDYGPVYLLEASPWIFNQHTPISLFYFTITPIIISSILFYIIIKRKEQKNAI